MFGRHSFRRRDSRRETVSSKAPRDLNIRKISVSGNSVSSSASFEDGFSSSSSLSSTPSSSFEDHRTPTQHDFIPSGPPPAPPARPTARATIIGTQATRRSTFHKHNPLKSHPSLAEVRTINHYRESSSGGRTSSPHQQGSRTSSPAPPRLANRRLLSHCEPQFQGPRRAVTMAAVETAMAMSGSFLYDDTDGEDDLHNQQPPKAVSLPPVMNKRQGFDFGLGEGRPRHNARPRQNTLERLQETHAELEGGARGEFEEPRPQLSRSHWSQSTLASSVADLDLGNKDDLLVEDDDDDEDDEDDDDPEPVTPVISVARPAVLLPNFSYKRPATLATTPQRPSMQAMDGTTPSGRWKRRGVVFNGGLGETAA